MRIRTDAGGTALALMLLCGGARAEGAPFSITEIPVDHRVAQADIADLDGDGRGDLLWVALEGVPPTERREIRAHFQRADGTLPPTPDWRSPVPEGVGAYDLANVDGRPGEELLLLRRDGLAVISLAGRSVDRTSLLVPHPPTIAAIQDERGLDRLHMVRSDFGPEPRIVIPGLGESTVLSLGGALLGQPLVGGRANFFLPPRPGLVITESEVEVYFDHPRVGAGDVDGDGRIDLFTSNRHELRVFRQREGGTFPREADQRLPFNRLSAEDHVRSVGSVRLEVGHFNDDARIDLLVTSSSGSFLEAKTQLAIHLNRAGTYDFENPDQVIHSDSGLAIAQIVDLDGDGILELVSVEIPSGVLELVEVLLTEEIDAEVEIRRRDGEQPFETDPWETRKLGVGINFDTFRTTGFVPNIEVDVNADGYIDFLSSGDGDRIEVYLGSREGVFGKRHATQKLDSGGRIRYGDLDGDRLTDFVLYDPRRPGVPIRVGANRGVLPGTPPAQPTISAAE